MNFPKVVNWRKIPITLIEVRFGGHRERDSPELQRLPALGQQIQRQRVAVGELIAFHHGHWRQHMPDAVRDEGTFVRITPPVPVRPR